MFQRVAVLLFCCFGAFLAFRNTRQIRMDLGGGLVPLARARGTVMDPFGVLERGYSPAATLQTIVDAQKELLGLQRVFETDVVEKNDGSFNIHCDLPGVAPKGKFSTFSTFFSFDFRRKSLIILSPTRTTHPIRSRHHH